MGIFDNLVLLLQSLFSILLYFAECISILDLSSLVCSSGVYKSGKQLKCLVVAVVVEVEAGK